MASEKWENASASPCWNLEFINIKCKLLNAYAGTIPNLIRVLITLQQADKLSRRREVANVVLDFSVKTATTYTPEFLGLSNGAWPREGGCGTAGEGIVIGFIDTGIDPTHSSFADDVSDHPYPVPDHFLAFDHASPFDGDGHGTHTASVAAGNHGIPVVVAGNYFGNASGMAPRSQCGCCHRSSRLPYWQNCFSHMTAACKAAQDGVDIISLSITPNRRPPAGTDMDKMYTPISAVHALSNEAIYLPTICIYSIRFVLGLSTVKQALQTAKNLSAAGVVFYMDPFVIGFQLNPTPLNMPGIIIPSSNDSKILLQYYNSSLERDGFGNIIRFGAVASISGGLKANYSISALKVMFYSARGPDPEDSFLDDSHIMKPNLVAAGKSIWAAWSESFAMMSGTSMAAPHIASLAALIKQKFPHFSPASIASALSTTESLYDKNGASHSNPIKFLLVASYEEYMSFLCGINGSSPVVLNYTGQNCQPYNSTVTAVDLNLPSITVAKLNQSKTVERLVTNIAGNEMYEVRWTTPSGVSMKVTPTCFFISTGEKQVLTITFNATTNDSVPSVGWIGLLGDGDHNHNIPLSVIVKFSYNMTNGRGLR
ncbi:Subtilase family protein isoform 3 [Hibiscus syriacus]|uniref:Subtilase family protein isoform 3 n=1 Tax=Hibiscus syriacus TaxID=106335 RepID=A0A6A2XCR8_HIBSY|nr:Subtilase family protein isoform 3 [Hibiscus syriacus]